MKPSLVGSTIAFILATAMPVHASDLNVILRELRRDVDNCRMMQQMTSTLSNRTARG